MQFLSIASSKPLRTPPRARHPSQKSCKWFILKSSVKHVVLAAGFLEDLLEILQCNQTVFHLFFSSDNTNTMPPCAWKTHGGSEKARFHHIIVDWSFATWVMWHAADETPQRRANAKEQPLPGDNRPLEVKGCPLTTRGGS